MFIISMDSKTDFDVTRPKQIVNILGGQDTHDWFTAALLRKLERRTHDFGKRWEQIHVHETHPVRKRPDSDWAHLVRHGERSKEEKDICLDVTRGRKTSNMRYFWPQKYWLRHTQELLNYVMNESTVKVKKRDLEPKINDDNNKSGTAQIFPFDKIIFDLGTHIQSYQRIARTMWKNGRKRLMKFWWNDVKIYRQIMRHVCNVFIS